MGITQGPGDSTCPAAAADGVCVARGVTQAESVAGRFAGLAIADPERLVIRLYYASPRPMPAL